MESDLRYAIIGIGNIGTSHVKMYKDGKIKEMVLTAVCDIKEDRLKAAKDLVPSVATFTDASEMMHSGLMDAVIIATPHYLHPPMATEALKAGLHVLCEKPAGVYTKAVRELNEFVKTQDKTYAIMFNQRTNHIYRKAHELVKSGVYGELRRVNWLITDWYRTQRYYDSGGWRATWDGEGGGVLMNQAPHNLDLWQWICGMPQKITAFCHKGKWHDIEVEDDVTIYAEYPNGATGVFITSTGDCPGDNRLEITLDKATIVCTADSIEVTELKTQLSEFTYDKSVSGFQKPEYEKKETETDGLNEQHAGVTNAFASHILHGTPLVAEGTEGINGLTICNAAYLSSWLGKTVELPLDEDLYLSELNKRRATSKAKKISSDTVENDMEKTF
ncbi:MAG: Gfo/Idh/MocA family oxidoreductase [Clostridiales bacterium]|nr:Gfo/Idh/MocA family oxidoreductase [Clostridiales bacterium]